jgi:16S rRNA (uracil1498-N3)-methyltransferase
MSIPRIWWPGGASGGTLMITGDAAHHLSHVLRVSSGDRVGVFDGRGGEWVGQVHEISRQHVGLTDVVAVTPVPEPRCPVTLAVGVLKGDQMDAVVRDATMLGAAAIAPMRTARVTVPAKAWTSGAARDRWQRVALASAAQCRRSVVPEVRPVADFDTCLREPFAMRLICVEPAAAADSAPADDSWKTTAPPSSLQILIGPEGGWSLDEIVQATAAGARPLHLGPRTLRAETTPVVALTVVAAAWGWQA